MGVLFLLFGLICLFGCRFYFKKEWNRDYLSIEQTQVIKGIFIGIVFFSHINSYVTYTSFKDELVRMFTVLLGQTMVAPFLFYSGYGVMESIRNKGKDYIAAIPKKRILGTLFRFDCVVVLFVLEELWRGKMYPLTRYLQAFVAWEHIENSNWYIFVILLLYGITYLTFRVFSEHKKALGASWLLVCLWIFCMDFWQIKGIWWYDTALCYVLGMTYSVYRPQIEKLLTRSRILYWLLIAALLAAVLLMRPLEYHAMGSSVRTLLFAFLVAAATMRIKVKSRILHWCGTHLFSLYILQRIPMLVFCHLGLAEKSIPLFGICCIVCTALLAIPFEYVTERLWKCLTKTT